MDSVFGAGGGSLPSRRGVGSGDANLTGCRRFNKRKTSIPMTFIELPILLFLLSLVDEPVHAHVNLDRLTYRPTSTSTAGVAFISKTPGGRHSIPRPSKCDTSTSVAATNDDINDYDISNNSPSPRQLLILRPPSRHTYGFMHHTIYDLPQIELRNLILSCATPTPGIYDYDGIQFIPVDNSVPSILSLDETKSLNKPIPQSKQQSKKRKKSKYSHHHVNLLHWIECSSGNDGVTITGDGIAKAASRAILTHATFAIHQSLSFTAKDWDNGALVNNDCDDVVFIHNNIQWMDILERMDIIDMTNPNLSRDDRSVLIKRVYYCLVNQQNPEKILSQLLQSNCSGDDDYSKSQPVLIHHCTSSPSHNHNKKQHSSEHVIYFGCRTSIGPAGTQGAPSQTLRRTHRGLLKQYALKERKVGVSHITSTAMEPEIGFLMANLALAGTGKPNRSRVLDPCCGSGSLLLYSAALGARTLVGVDSDPDVWRDAKLEFQRHTTYINDGETQQELAVPIFYCGDVQNPGSTEAFCSAESFDAIVCDPPYNIGAPVLVGGEDQRPETKDESGFKAGISTTQVLPDLVPHLLTIAREVLVDQGRLVIFLPVRGEEMAWSIEKLLLSRGCLEWEVGVGEHDIESDCSLCLLKESTRLQQFSPTFARWLVCMEKREVL